jgi:hypothetical protein
MLYNFNKFYSIRMDIVHKHFALLKVLWCMLYVLHCMKCQYISQIRVIAFHIFAWERGIDKCELPPTIH